MISRQMRKKPSTMDLSKGAFIVYGQGGWWWARRGGPWGQKFVTYSHGEVRRGGGGVWGERIFFSALFLCFFCERAIICIRTQTHKGMLLKYAGGGGRGEGERGRQKFSHSIMGVGGDLFPMYSMYSWGGEAIFWGATNFAKPPPPPPPALNNERSLRKQKEYIQWIHDAHWCTVSALYT